MEKKTGNEIEVLNLDEKVTIHNLAGWTIGFHRLSDGMGDVSIPANGTARLSRNEILMQAQNGNRLFAGMDFAGSHATIWIDDAATRKEAGFETDEVPQNILNEEKLKNLFALKAQKTFEKKVQEVIVTRAEKYAVMTMIKKLKLNDYSKIRFLEEYTGYDLANS